MKSVRRDDHIIFSSDNGQMALYDPENGDFFGINTVGEFLWNQMVDWISVEALIAHTVNTFDGSSELIKQDVQVFLEAMMENNLILTKTE